jgi:hypothetical protein
MRNGKDVDGSRIFRHCCGIFLDGQRKTMRKPLSEDSVPQLRLRLSTSRIKGRNVSN